MDVPLLGWSTNPQCTIRSTSICRVTVYIYINKYIPGVALQFARAKSKNKKNYATQPKRLRGRALCASNGPAASWVGTFDGKAKGKLLKEYN